MEGFLDSLMSRRVCQAQGLAAQVAVVRQEDAAAV
jgi:hypothetical protein